MCMLRYIAACVCLDCVPREPVLLMHLLCYLLSQNCFCLWVDIRNIAGHRVHHTVLLEPQNETLVGL